MKKTPSQRMIPSELRMVAWELTRRCNLSCRHCRASSEDRLYEGELTTEECFRVMDEIASIARPVIILTGGEPYLRDDIFELASYGDKKGLRMVLATNGTTVTDKIAEMTRESRIRRVSVSIDGKNAARHDSFRGVEGAFEDALRGIEALKRAGVEFQINATITKHNSDQMEAIIDLAVALGAAACHIFLLVPTGRGTEIAGETISAEEYETLLNAFYDKSLNCPIDLKATCAPHYMRIAHERNRGKAVTEKKGHALHGMTRGCLGGISFCFISGTGRVQPCGFFDIDCGQVREEGFVAIWNESKIFSDLRDLTAYKGKCGRCEYLRLCGGCRARAFESAGDYLGEEPLCLHVPEGLSRSPQSGERTEASVKERTDRRGRH